MAPDSQGLPIVHHWLLAHTIQSVPDMLEHRCQPEGANTALPIPVCALTWTCVHVGPLLNNVPTDGMCMHHAILTRPQAHQHQVYGPPGATLHTCSW
jgi:hypothetical protein